ncbi:MAG: hypothetical protein IJI43_01860 [Bacilli bacterium]|nr:hypothetical protein [Bacilli bacterium]
MNNNSKANKKNELLKGILLGITLVLVLLIIVIQVEKSFTFTTEELPEISDLELQSKTNNKYQTIIIADNKYTGINVNSKKSAKKLIEKDSIKQKDTCSDKIISIENKMIKDFDITAVNLCEMDVSLANELYDVLAKIYKEYPTVRGYMTNISLRNSSIENDKVIAAFIPTFEFAKSDTLSTYPWIYKTEILLNANYFLNRDKLSNTVFDATTSGYFPPNATMYSPVAHEFGHYLSFIALLKKHSTKDLVLVEKDERKEVYKIAYDYSKGIYSKKILEEAYNNYINDTGSEINFVTWSRTISSYAITKDEDGAYIYDETIAEAFHDTYLNGNNAKDASKYITNVLKDKLRG